MSMRECYFCATEVQNGGRVRAESSYVRVKRGGMCVVGNYCTIIAEAGGYVKLMGVHSVVRMLVEGHLGVVVRELDVEALAACVGGKGHWHKMREDMKRLEVCGIDEERKVERAWGDNSKDIVEGSKEGSKDGA